MADEALVKQAVLAAVIKDGNRFLVCKRPQHKRHGGLWEFPGGKLEAGEDLLACARRELCEELSLKAEALGAVLFQGEDPGSPFIIQFVEVEVSGSPSLHEHEELLWLTLKELADLQLAPSDRAFVDFLSAL